VVSWPKKLDQHGVPCSQRYGVNWPATEEDNETMVYWLDDVDLQSSAMTGNQVPRQPLAFARSFSHFPPVPPGRCLQNGSQVDLDWFTKFNCVMRHETLTHHYGLLAKVLNPEFLDELFKLGLRIFPYFRYRTEKPSERCDINCRLLTLMAFVDRRLTLSHIKCLECGTFCKMSFAGSGQKDEHTSKGNVALHNCQSLVLESLCRHSVE
jgi:hypothetical protein